MRVQAVRQRAHAGRRELHFEAVFGDAPETPLPLWLTAPDHGPLPAEGDPILTGLIVPAMVLREDLEIEAPVSAELLDRARERMEPFFRRQFPETRGIEIRAAETVPPASDPPAQAVAAFYSGGVDSSYTLHRNRDRLTHLIFVRGFDLPNDDREGLERGLARARAAADARGLEVLELANNLRFEFVKELRRRLRPLGRWDPRFNAERQMGSLMVAFAQMAATSAGRVLVPSSWPGHRAEAKGSGPGIEPAWSTSRQAYELDGADVDRIGKVAWLAREAPESFRDLEVCLRLPRPERNCGTCPKCVRLRLEIRAAGIPEPAAGPFAEPLDLAQLRRSFVRVDDVFWPSIVEHARARGDEALARTAEILLERRFHLPRELARLRERMSAAGRSRLRRRRVPATT